MIMNILVLAGVFVLALIIGYTVGTKAKTALGNVIFIAAALILVGLGLIFAPPLVLPLVKAAGLGLGIGWIITIFS
jgi:hypothetical protein